MSTDVYVLSNGILMEDLVSMFLPCCFRNPLRRINLACEETGADKDIMFSPWWVMDHQSRFFGLLHISFEFLLAVVLEEFLL